MKKTCVLLITLVAGIHIHAAPYVQDFESFSAGAISNGSGSLAGTITDGNNNVQTGGGAGSRTYVDESGNIFARMGRTFRDSQSVTLGELVTLSDAGLTVGQEYQLSFDYRIVLVGTGTSNDVEIRFGALQDDGAYAQASGVEVSLGDYSPSAGNGTSALINYSDSTALTVPAGSQPVSSWTGHTFNETFTFTAGNTTAGWLISATGVGVDGSTYDAANSTYLDLDNVTISAIPEPSVFAFLGLSVGVLFYIRRRR